MNGKRREIPQTLCYCRSEGSFNSVRQIALAIGLKMKKRLTNSQSRFQLREEYYLLKKIYQAI